MKFDTLRRRAASLGRLRATTAMPMAALALSCAVLTPGAASAAMTLNATGISDGFVLSTFATLPSNGAYGAWGSAVLSNGHVVVNGYNSANVSQTVNYVFTDVDGQTPGTALSVSPWADGNYASALARVGSTVYGTHYSDNTVRIVNSDGSEGTVISNVGRGGLGGDLARNSLLVATDAGIEEIDLSNPNPATNHHVVANVYADGVTVSADGQTVYGEVGGHIYGYTIGGAPNQLVYDSGYLGDPDGVGIILSGALIGQLIVNDNSGHLSLLDVINHTSTVIATGGSRGDYVGFDPSNGTVFLSQGDSLLRLGLQGGTIGDGGGGGGVPEPAAWALMIAGFGLAGATLRRQRHVAIRA